MVDRTALEKRNPGNWVVSSNLTSSAQMKKILPIISLFLGESLSIYAEVAGAKSLSAFNATFWKTSGIMAIAGLFLVAGYMFGLRYLQNIWIVGAVSVASIIIMEPLITYLVFHELPARGAVIGLAFGICGLLSALFIK